MKIYHSLALAAFVAAGTCAIAQQTPNVLWHEPNPTISNFLRTVAWSPDGTILASGGGDVSTSMGNRGDLVFWNSMTGGLIQRVTEWDGLRIRRLNDIVFHPSGTWVATAEGQGPNSTWAISGQSARHSVPAGEREMFYPVQPSAMVGIDISSDGTLLARAQHDNREVWVVDANSGNVVFQWEAHSHGVRAVKFSPDNQHLATAGRFDGTIRIWRLSDQQLVRGFPAVGSNSGSEGTIAFSPDGQLIAGAVEGYDQPFRLWRVSDGQLLWSSNSIGYLAQSRVRFTPDGRYLVMGERSSEPNSSWMGRIRFLNVASGTVEADWHFTGIPNNGVTDFDLSPLGDYIAFSQYTAGLTVAANPVHNPTRGPNRATRR
jgi:WD40 repeat protein